MIRNNHFKQCIIALTCISLCIVQQNSFAQVKQGTRIPNLLVDEIYRGKARSPLDIRSLTGKVVVLEFWATWCVPCIEQFPHLNTLIHEFKKEEVQFISITAETKDIVKPFFKKWELDGWIGLDIDRSIIDYFGVTELPTTIIIDKQGYIREQIHPAKLNAALIDRYLKTESLAITPHVTGVSAFNAATDDIVKIAPQGGSQRAFDRKTGVLKGKLPTRVLLSLVCDVSPNMVQGDTALLNQWLQVNFDGQPDSTQSFETRVIKKLSTVLNASIEKKNREDQVYVLSVPKKSELKLTEVKPSSGLRTSSNWGMISASESPVNNINFINAIESAVGKAVKDETGLTGIYNFTLTWDTKKPLSIIQSIKEQLGLTLVLETRKIHFVEVKSN